MAVKDIKIRNCTISIVFRHRFEEKERKKSFDRTFKRWELGLWVKKSMIVGRKDFSNPKKWGSNLVPSWMFGVELFVCRAWFEIDFGGMHFELPEEETPIKISEK
jgi:hypothetical protein